MPYEKTRKEYYLKNKEKIKQKQKEWYLKNKEKIQENRKEYEKKYRQTEQGKKTQRISKWKHQGIIFHDYDLLYEIFLQTTHCDECKCLLTYDKRTTKTTKCLDHDHTITDDNNVRNILCHCCNASRR